MDTYTAEYTVSLDGIYRTKLIYNPGRGWERMTELWLPRSAVEAALALWSADRQDDRK